MKNCSSFAWFSYENVLNLTISASFLCIFSNTSLSILRWGIVWERTRVRVSSHDLVIPECIWWLNAYCFALYSFPHNCKKLFSLTAVECFIDLPHTIPKPCSNNWDKTHHSIHLGLVSHVHPFIFIYKEFHLMFYFPVHQCHEVFLALCAVGLPLF